jgi:hypothetical protein
MTIDYTIAIQVLIKQITSAYSRIEFSRVCRAKVHTIGSAIGVSVIVSNATSAHTHTDLFRICWTQVLTIKGSIAITVCLCLVAATLQFFSLQRIRGTLV